MRIKAALGVGLILTALAVVVALAHAPLVVVRDNSPLTHTELVRTTGPAEACQTHEALPSGTTAVRIGLTTVLGGRVIVKIFSAGHQVLQGAHAPGWEGASVTVPVKPLRRSLASTQVCIGLEQLNGPIGMLGWHTGKLVAATANGKPLPGRMHLEYLRVGPQTWWSMASAVARRLGLGRPASGTWNALLVMALAGAVVALSSWLLTRELR